MAQDRHTIEAHAPHLTLPLICPAQQAEMLNVLLYALCNNINASKNQKTKKNPNKTKYYIKIVVYIM